MTSWDREKQTLLDNYIKEKKELRAQFERLLREKEEGFKAEKAEMEAKIRKELEGIEEVKNELRRTLSQGLGDLENVYFEENAYLETLYNHEQPEVDMHFKSILDAEMSLDKEELLKSLKQEKTKMHSHYANKHKLVEHLSSSRWKSSGTWNRGSNSKSTI